MDLLSGYGSDASDEGAARPEALPSELAGESRTQKIGVGAAIPAPSTTTVGMPAAAGAPRGKRRPVQFRIPIKVDYGTDSDEEEQQPKKKARQAKQSVRFADSLPAPKNTSLFDTLASKKVRGSAGDDEDDIMAMRDPIASEPSPFLPAEGGNEAYRVDDVLEDYIPTAGTGLNVSRGINAAPVMSSAPLYDRGGSAGEPVPQEGLEDVRYDQNDTRPGNEQAGSSAADALLQQAFQEEAEKAASRSRRADPFASGAVKFVEVDQQKLRYVSPQQKEAANAARTAFGADYESRLRREAGPAPGGKAKRKHQIGSLYHAAKMKELEMMEMRGQALKTKAETQAKYGW